MLKLIFWALFNVCFNNIANPAPTPIIYEKLPSAETCSLPAPSSGSGIHHGTWVECSWSSVSGAANYHIVIRRVSDNAIVIDDIVHNTSYSTSVTSTGDHKAYVSAICNDDTESSNIIIIDMNGV